MYLFIYTDADTYTYTYETNGYTSHTYTYETNVYTWQMGVTLVRQARAGVFPSHRFQHHPVGIPR